MDYSNSATNLRISADISKANSKKFVYFGKKNPTWRLCTHTIVSENYYR